MLLLFSSPMNVVPTGVLTYRRYQLPESCLPKWNESNEPLCKIHVSKNKTIEDMDGLLQVKKIRSLIFVFPDENFPFQGGFRQ